MRIELAIAVASLAFAPAALAKGPCADEIHRFCEKKAPLKVLSCLQAHQPELSDGCKKHVENVEVNLQNAKIDCEPDAFAFCRDSAPGEAMVGCLGKQQGKLTRRCQAVFDDFAHREARNRSVCASDASRLCPKAHPGKGEVHVCLVFHGEEVSPACHDALTR